MKILAYTENYAHKTVTFITNELEYLDEHHELTLVFSTRINEDLYKRKSMVHMPYKYGRIVNKVRWWLEQFEVYYWIRNFQFGKKLNALLDEVQPDLIHCHFGVDFLKLAANIEKRHTKIPVFISLYGFDVTEKLQNRAILRQYQKLFSRNNSHGFAVSTSLAKLANNKVKPINKIAVLHSGINTDFYQRKIVEKVPGTYTFLQISSYLQKKGHYWMLEAFRKFIDVDNRLNYRLILIGFGPLEGAVKARVKELKLENYVLMLPPVSPEGMVEFCSKSDCFVQMSVMADNGDQEGLPNALLEAMALELPILSTRHAGIPDIVENGVDGILCEEKNIDDYVAAFKEIVSWPIMPLSRKKIVENFSFRKHCERLEIQYEKLTTLNESTKIFN